MKILFSIEQKGDFGNLEKYLKKLENGKTIDSILERYARIGLQQLEDATPVDTGRAKGSWYYKIEKTKDSVSITYYNSDIENGFPVAIMIDLGHGTKGGGWVAGRHFISPIVEKNFQEIADSVWREVTKV